MLAPRSIVALYAQRNRYFVTPLARVRLAMEARKLACVRLGHAGTHYITTKTEVTAVCERCGEVLKTVPVAQAAVA